uniref:Uncharacterized protein n=1 Tax=Anguilla anguilla TaxID=7936 RepID=A0A0E9RT67_ANGAN
MYLTLPQQPYAKVVAQVIKTPVQGVKNYEYHDTPD